MHHAEQISRGIQNNPVSPDKHKYTGIAVINVTIIVLFQIKKLNQNPILVQLETTVLLSLF